MLMIHTNDAHTLDPSMPVYKAREEAGVSTHPNFHLIIFFHVTIINTFLKTEVCLRERKERK